MDFNDNVINSMYKCSKSNEADRPAGRAADV